MKNRILFLTGLALLCLYRSSTAQNYNESSLAIEGKAVFLGNDEIAIRWLPANYKTWTWGRDSGYTIIRVTLEDASGPLNIDAQNQSLTTYQLLPRPQAVWEAAMLNDEMVGIAAGAYFGDDFTVGANAAPGITMAQNLNTEKENRFGLSLFAADVSPDAANLQNLYFKDKNVTPGNTYLYMVRLNGVTNGHHVKIARLSVKAADPYQPPTPQGLAITAGDSLAILSWDHLATSEAYTAYHVWRSAGNGTFEKVNKQPVTPTESSAGQNSGLLRFATRLPDNTQTYTFRITGFSPFGINGPPSAEIQVKGKAEPLKARASILQAEETTSGMKVKWEFPTELNGSITGFNVLRSKKHEGPYEKMNTTLLGSTVREFTDGNPMPSNYYKVEFIDINSYTIGSVPLLAQPKDEEPPKPPNLVLGESVGTDGTIKLHWTPSVSEDVMGYRVFMCDQANGDYAQITSTWIKDTILFHKVNASTLTEKKFFRVRAVDHRENTSIDSDVATIHLTDIVPPAVPVLKKVESLTEGIRIEFAPSNSTDITAHRIMRRKKDHAEWELVTVLDSIGAVESISVLDTLAEKMYAYDYMVQAVDDADLSSNSKMFAVKNKEDGIRKPVEKFKARFVKSTEAIELSWDYNNAYGISAFVIYRGTTASNLVEVATVVPQQVLSGGTYNGPEPTNNITNNGDPLTYLDNNPINMQPQGAPNSTYLTNYEHQDKDFSRYKKYYYAVGVKFNDGTLSPLCPSQNTSTY